jgi:hypothetical protein
VVRPNGPEPVIALEMPDCVAHESWIDERVGIQREDKVVVVEFRCGVCQRLVQRTRAIADVSDRFEYLGAGAASGANGSVRAVVRGNDNSVDLGYRGRDGFFDAGFLVVRRDQSDDAPRCRPPPRCRRELRQ